MKLILLYIKLNYESLKFKWKLNFKDNNKIKVVLYNEIQIQMINGGTSRAKTKQKSIDDQNKYFIKKNYL